MSADILEFKRRQSEPKPSSPGAVQLFRPAFRELIKRGCEKPRPASLSSKNQVTQIQIASSILRAAAAGVSQHDAERMAMDLGCGPEQLPSIRRIVGILAGAVRDLNARNTSAHVPPGDRLP